MADRYMHQIKLTNIMEYPVSSITVIILIASSLICLQSIGCHQPLPTCLVTTSTSNINSDDHSNNDIRTIPATQTHLYCHNVSLQLINADYLLNTNTVYNEIQLENIYIERYDEHLVVKNESRTESLKWINSNVSTKQLDGLFLNDKRFIRLRILDLSYNHIVSITADHLRRLQSLKQLNLTNNDIGELPYDLFTDVRSLVELNLSSNQLKSIVSSSSISDYGLFINLNELLVLDLAKNSINDLPRQAFNGLSSLIQLSLAHNKLYVVPFQIFKHLKNIELLDLSGNRLKSFLDNFFTPNKKLLQLHLNNNRIEQLSKHSLYGLKQLKILDISENELIQIDRNAFDSLINLHHLNVSGNNITIISSTLFSSLNNLNVLDLSRNRFKQLPNAIFASQWNLQELILDETAVESLNTNWISRTNTTINTEILANLKYVQICNNHDLIEIDSIVFVNTPAIEHLRLAGNQLRILPKELGELTKLKILDVSGNQLVSVPWQIGNLNNLIQLHLMDNNFACDCRMYWLVNWMEELQLKLETQIEYQKSLDILHMQLTQLKCRHGYPGDMMRVLQQLQCTKPVILHSTESKMYLLRSDSILECSFSGNPAPDIMWVTPTNKILRYYADPDAKPILIEPNGKYHKKYEFQMLIGSNLNFSAASKAVGVSLLENGSLKVHNISRKDSGVYTCYGYNIMGNTTADIR